jgi:hypothetical protein
VFVEDSQLLFFVLCHPSGYHSETSLGPAFFNDATSSAEAGIIESVS